MFTVGMRPPRVTRALRVAPKPSHAWRQGGTTRYAIDSSSRSPWTS
ncbi:hypothetical protein [Streptomyces sp. NPDC101455]